MSEQPTEAEVSSDESELTFNFDFLIRGEAGQLPYFVMMRNDETVCEIADPAEVMNLAEMIRDCAQALAAAHLGVQLGIDPRTLIGMTGINAEDLGPEEVNGQ